MQEHTWVSANLPPLSLTRDFGKRNTRGNVSKIAVSRTCYRQIGSKSTNHSQLAWRREGQRVTLLAVICGFRSDLSITRKTDGNFGNVSAKMVVNWIWNLQWTNIPCTKNQQYFSRLMVQKLVLTCRIWATQPVEEFALISVAWSDV